MTWVMFWEIFRILQTSTTSIWQTHTHTQKEVYLELCDSTAIKHNWSFNLSPSEEPLISFFSSNFHTVKFNWLNRGAAAEYHEY